jgi:hypothetical protein
MVCFQTKIPNLGKFCNGRCWFLEAIAMEDVGILWTLGTFYSLLLYFMDI